MTKTLSSQVRMFPNEPSPSDQFPGALDASKTGLSSARDFDEEMIDSRCDEETSHLQADGFWGFEKGFHDAEQLWRQRQQQN